MPKLLSEVAISGPSLTILAIQNIIERGYSLLFSYDNDGWTCVDLLKCDDHDRLMSVVFHENMYKDPRDEFFAKSILDMVDKYERSK